MFEAELEGIQQLVVAEEDQKVLASLLLSLQQLRSSLGALVDDVQERLASTMKGQEQDLGTGIGVIRRSRETKTRWNHEEMLKLLMDDVKTVDSGTGEVEINGFELANAIKECVAFSYWRKTPLRDRKIDFGEYCTSEYGRYRIRFLSKEGS